MASEIPGKFALLLFALCLALLLPLPSVAEGNAGAEKEASSIAFEPGQVMPLEPRSRPFRIVEGDRRGERLAVRLTAGEKSGQWELHLGEDQVLFLRRGEDGGLYLTRILVKDEQKSVVYQDPLPLLVGSSAPPRVARTRVRIYNLKDGSLERSGPVRHRVDEITPTYFRVGEEKVSGYLVRYRHRIELKGAEVKARVDVGFLPGVGLVRGRGRFVTEKAFWFDSRTVIAAELESSGTGNRGSSGAILETDRGGRDRR